MFNPEMLQDAIEAAAAVGPDMTQAAAGGGDYSPPAAGIVRLRLVSYIELGKHEDEYKGQKKQPEKVALQFELSGPKHQPREFEGRKIPDIVTLTLTKHLNEKAGFYKMFKRLNHTGDAKHFAQLLGREFLGTIVHKEVGEGDQKKLYANLRDDAGFTIRPPFIDAMNEETGDIESKRIIVDPALTPLKCFIWDAPQSLKEMWDSLFIDGKWDDKKDEKTGAVIKEGKSKNHWQNTIKAAINFDGSPIHQLLFAGGEPDLSAGAAAKPERTEENVQAAAAANVGGAAEDPLAGM